MDGQLTMRRRVVCADEEMAGGAVHPPATSASPTERDVAHLCQVAEQLRTTCDELARARVALDSVAQQLALAFPK